MFYIQDPRNKDSRLLVDELVRCLEDSRVTSWKGMFAFASADGAIATLGSDSFQDFHSRGGDVSLLIGIDSVTNVKALEWLADFSSSRPRVQIEVFASRQPRTLFHPKFSFFSGDDYEELLLGSGNFTMGGLRRNYEAFLSHVREAGSPSLWTNQWTDFYAHNAESIGPIDDEALERARSNALAMKAAREAVARATKHEDVPLELSLEDGEFVPTRVGLSAGWLRTLIAEVPRAASRWRQVHFDANTALDFFGLGPGSELLIQLQGYEFGEPQVPEVRKLIYSTVNVNKKIEIATRKGEPYPEDDLGRPILVVREDGTRTFSYVLLMPGDAGYQETRELLYSLPGPTGTQVRREVFNWSDVVDEVPEIAALLPE